MFPSSLAIGCRPSARPTMLSRRLTRPTPSRSKPPSSSGPRWKRASAMRSRTPAGSGLGPDKSASPAMPHMQPSVEEHEEAAEPEAQPGAGFDTAYHGRILEAGRDLDIYSIPVLAYTDA